MQYLVATYRFGGPKKKASKLIPVADDVKIGEVRYNLYNHGWMTMIVEKPPSKRTLRRWKKENKGRSLDNCWTIGYNSCSHGERSWLQVLGV